MPSKTVTVAFVNQPMKNPSFGSIKTTEGEFFSVKKAMLSRFTKGMVCTVDYEVNQVNDRQFYNIIGIQENVPQSAANAGVSHAATEKDKIISRIAIAKSLIESHPDMSAIGNVEALQDIGEQWLNWIYRDHA